MMSRTVSEDNITSKISRNQLSFPISRVKKIIRADTDITQCHGDAVLIVTALAEVFLDHLSRQTSRLSDLERRKTITYRDVAMTVAEDSRLAFLEEIIPKTISLSEGIARRHQLETSDLFPIDAGDSVHDSTEDEENLENIDPLDEDEEDLDENHLVAADSD